MTWQAAIGTVCRRHISGTFGLVPAYRGTRLNIARSVSIIMLHLPEKVPEEMLASIFID